MTIETNPKSHPTSVFIYIEREIAAFDRMTRITFRQNDRLTDDNAADKRAVINAPAHSLEPQIA